MKQSLVEGGAELIAELTSGEGRGHNHDRARSDHMTETMADADFDPNHGA
jgi:hypothetical protein